MQIELSRGVVRYTHTCPLYGTLAHADRYPRAVCHMCAPGAVDSAGRRTRRDNVSFSGGIVVQA